MSAPAVDKVDIKAELQGQDLAHEVSHVEGKAVNFVTDNSNEISNDANLTFWQTNRRYWRAMAISFACGVCAMGDGYQYKMPGNIVALKGFIQQMGSFDEATQAYKLNPQQVAAWGGTYAGALVVILLVGNWPIDYFGRKPALWAVQIFMIIAALIECFATDWTHWLAAKIMNVSEHFVETFSVDPYVSDHFLFFLRNKSWLTDPRASLSDATRWRPLHTSLKSPPRVPAVPHLAFTSSSYVFSFHSNGFFSLF